MRLACDTGGTFTDLIVESTGGRLEMFKASTTPDDPVNGVLDAIALAANAANLSLPDYLAGVEQFVHGTTHAINAVITGRTARTAFLATAGHPDILVLREGGRRDPFNATAAFPDPYVPRALTFEVAERVMANGSIAVALDEQRVVDLCKELRALEVEAVAVCLLWSVVNPAHELRIGELLDTHLPGIPYTLSHQLNPTIREFRRASAAAIDASLKPLMGRYLGSLSGRLRDAGFSGKLMVLTSQGGMAEADEVARTPIRAINSGPSLAPVAGRHFGAAVEDGMDIIVADTGGTTYDVSLVRGGRIPLTRDAWIGAPFEGHLTGFPSVDVQSVGAGGGSIARVDAGGMLHVGPMSAGAMPGPACYRRGGTLPTLTDACLVLGYLDADYFLGGSLSLDAAAAGEAVEQHVAIPLGVEVEQAAGAIVALATENMVQAIADIAVSQGIDTTRALLIGGGGAAGFNSVFIARRLKIPLLVIPELGPALSAGGAVMSDLVGDFRAVKFVTTADFDLEAANEVLASLKAQALQFLRSVDAGEGGSISFSTEARYEQQVWEIEVPLPFERFESSQDVDRFVNAMHDAHEAIFAFCDKSSAVEIVGWTARATNDANRRGVGRLDRTTSNIARSESRPAWFAETGFVQTAVVAFEQMEIDRKMPGPAIIESPFTSVVADPASTFWRREDGSLVIATGPTEAQHD